jgi:hypothetical protein
MFYEEMKAVFGFNSFYWTGINLMIVNKTTPANFGHDFTLKSVVKASFFS